MLGMLVIGPLKFWFWGTALLAAVSISLAVAFSNLFINAVATAIGIVTTDAGDFSGSFEEGQRAAGGGGDSAGASDAEGEN